MEKRRDFLYKMMNDAIMNGVIIDPQELKEGMDYETYFKNFDETHPDDFLNRGFPHRVYKSVRTNLWTFSIPNSVSVFNNPNQPGYPHQDFLQLISAILYYADTLDQQYPAEKYPLLRKRIDFVIDYLKNDYDIDLLAIGSVASAKE